MTATAPTPAAAPAAPDLGLFGPGSVTWRIHADPAMVVAGMRALILQALHPVTMAGFAANTSWNADPWGRLERTGEWVSRVTYGTTAEAEEAGRWLRRLHARLPGGVEPETGRAYRVDDPALLLWVHVTEVESFLDGYRRCGGSLEPGDADRYVDEMRESARLVGLDPRRVPGTEAEIAAYYDEVRPELHLTEVARRMVARNAVPAMPLAVSLLTPARPAWLALQVLALSMLPPWARRLYGLPGLPTTDLAAPVLSRAVRAAVGALPQEWRESPARRAARERVARAGRG